MLPCAGPSITVFSSQCANVSLSPECELFHETPHRNLGSGGRGAELAVLFHHEARVEHRAVDHAGRETPRSAFYLLSLLHSSEKEPVQWGPSFKKVH